jgi:hypothetical protein
MFLGLCLAHRAHVFPYYYFLFFVAATAISQVASWMCLECTTVECAAIGEGLVFGFRNMFRCLRVGLAFLLLVLHLRGEAAASAVARFFVFLAGLTFLACSMVIWFTRINIMSMVSLSSPWQCLLLPRQYHFLAFDLGMNSVSFILVSACLFVVLKGSGQELEAEGGEVVDCVADSPAVSNHETNASSFGTFSISKDCELLDPASDIVERDDESLSRGPGELSFGLSSPLRDAVGSGNLPIWEDGESESYNFMSEPLLRKQQEDLVYLEHETLSQGPGELSFGVINSPMVDGADDDKPQWNVSDVRAGLKLDAEASEVRGAEGAGEFEFETRGNDGFRRLQHKGFSRSCSQEERVKKIAKLSIGRPRMATIVLLDSPARVAYQQVLFRILLILAFCAFETFVQSGVLVWQVKLRFLLVVS